MSDLISNVINKLEEYGVGINSKYEGDNNEYVIVAENMVVMIYKEKNEISISFFVGTRPDDSANAILILQEIVELKDINIMESYALINDKEIVQGEEAYEIFKNNISREAVKDHVLQNIYKELLMNCENCPEC